MKSGAFIVHSSDFILNLLLRDFDIRMDLHANVVLPGGTNDIFQSGCFTKE